MHTGSSLSLLSPYCTNSSPPTPCVPPSPTIGMQLIISYYALISSVLTIPKVSVLSLKCITCKLTELSVIAPEFASISSSSYHHSFHLTQTTIRNSALLNICDNYWGIEHFTKVLLNTFLRGKIDILLLILLSNEC